jgi:hypothetical protein
MLLVNHAENCWQDNVGTLMYHEYEIELKNKIIRQPQVRYIMSVKITNFFTQALNHVKRKSQEYKGHVKCGLFFFVATILLTKLRDFCCVSCGCDFLCKKFFRFFHIQMILTSIAKKNAPASFLSRTKTVFLLLRIRTIPFLIK